MLHIELDNGAAYIYNGVYPDSIPEALERLGWEPIDTGWRTTDLKVVHETVTLFRLTSVVSTYWPGWED